jgi:Spy/CpxP family protein refolding chaperone
MKIKIIFAAAAAIVAGGLLTTTLVAADNAAPAAMSLRGHLFQRIADKLALTADQQAQVKTVLAGEKDTLKTLLSQVHDARKNLRAAIQAGDANESSVRAASAKVASAEADLAVERMKLFGRISPVLTDEQRQKISEFRQRADESAENVIAHVGAGLAE